MKKPSKPKAKVAPVTVELSFAYVSKGQQNVFQSDRSSPVRIFQAYVSPETFDSSKPIRATFTQ